MIDGIYSNLHYNKFSLFFKPCNLIYMLKNLVWILIALASTSGVNAAIAADDPRWYEIEVIVFSNNNRDALNSENWPVDPGTPIQKTMVELVSPDEPVPTPVENAAIVIPTTAPSAKKPAKPEPAPVKADSDNGQFIQLKEEELGLSEEALKIATSQEYHLLLHTGWRQPLEKNIDAKNVYLDQTISSYQKPVDPEDNPAAQSSPEDKILNALIGNDKTHPTIGMTQDPAAAPIDAARVNPAMPEGPTQSLVYGVMSLKMSRFLHFAVDMVYRAPYQVAQSIAQANAERRNAIENAFPMLGKETAKEDATVESPPAVNNNPLDIIGFRLLETRRIKTNELIYFDHPLFGVIARIRPYDPPER